MAEASRAERTSFRYRLGRRSGPRGQLRVRTRARWPGRCARHHRRGPGAFRSPATCCGSGGGARRQHFASRCARAGARRAHGARRPRRDPPHSRRFHGGGGRRRRRRPLDVVTGNGEAVVGRAKVVITDYVWESLDVERKTLGDLAEIVALKTKKPEEFLSEARDCDALLNTYAGPITAEAMSGMPRCKIIARYGIGVDTIDLEAATQAGIIVTNNPTYCIEEVAEQTMALILASARKIPVRAAAFGLAVLYSDPFVKEGQFKVPGKAVDLDTLLRDSDFVSLHPPLTPQTRKMIGEAAFGKMKPTAVLVNCARGPIVDTDALVRALDAKQIAGAALDTVDPEPLPDPHPLRGRDNVILNPHVAWYSEQAMAGLQAGAPGEVRRVLSGEWPVNVVNRAVKAKNRAGL